MPTVTLNPSFVGQFGASDAPSWTPAPPALTLAAALASVDGQRAAALAGSLSAPGPKFLRWSVPPRSLQQGETVAGLRVRITLGNSTLGEMAARVNVANRPEQPASDGVFSAAFHNATPLEFGSLTANRWALTEAEVAAGFIIELAIDNTEQTEYEAVLDGLGVVELATTMAGGGPSAAARATPNRGTRRARGALARRRS